MTKVEEWYRTKLVGNNFSNHNFMELESRKPDRAIFRLKVRPESLNSIGGLHGGAFYTLADMATSTAASTDGKSYVTQSGSLHFIATQYEGGVARAIAQVRHRGRVTTVVAVDVVGENNRLLATGEFAFSCSERGWTDRV